MKHPFRLKSEQFAEGDSVMVELNKPRFQLGKVVATPAALEALDKANQQPWQLLARHLQGDWGDLGAEDRRLNGEALHDGGRILSAYLLTTGVRLWIITEAQDDRGNRAATTLLLPEEY
jgi:hypothetical protein